MELLKDTRGHDLIAKIRKLEGLGEKATLDRLYAILGILDAKASGLLTLDALFITVLAIFFQGTVASGNPPPNPELFGPSTHVIIGVQIGLASLSAFLCLMVVRIFWRFMGHVKVSGEKMDFTGEIQRLANVIFDRTGYTWLAWHLAVIAFVLTLAWWTWIFALVVEVIVLAWAFLYG